LTRPVTYASNRAQLLFCMPNQYGSGAVPHHGRVFWPNGQCGQFDPGRIAGLDHAQRRVWFLFLGSLGKPDQCRCRRQISSRTVAAIGKKRLRCGFPKFCSYDSVVLTPEVGSSKRRMSVSFAISVALILPGTPAEDGAGLFRAIRNGDVALYPEQS
jgi:hypothetical protein